MSSTNGSERLRVLMKARYPLIWVVSHEEERVIEAIRSIKKGEVVLTWEVGIGFQNEK